MITLEIEYESAPETATVELRVALSREVLTAALYDLGMSEWDLATYSDEEIRTSALSMVLFEGHGSAERRADVMFARYQAGRLGDQDAKWWALCAERVGAVFGLVPVGSDVVRAGVSAR